MPFHLLLIVFHNQLFRVANSLDPEWQIVWIQIEPDKTFDMVTNCLQKLSADDTSRQIMVDEKETFGAIPKSCIFPQCIDNAQTRLAKNPAILSSYLKMLATLSHESFV